MDGLRVRLRGFRKSHHFIPASLIPAQVGHQEIAVGDGHERVQARRVRLNLYPK